VITPRATVRAYGWRVSAQRQSGNDTRGARISGDVCAAGCAVQEGGRAARKARSGEHAATEVHAVPCAALSRCPVSLAATEAVGTLLGFRHTARRRLRRAVCEERGGSRGRWSRVRWSSARCGRRLRSSSVGKVRWWGVAMAAHPRGDGGEGAVFSNRE
jgi:hypothetical protein